MTNVVRMSSRNDRPRQGSPKSKSEEDLGRPAHEIKNKTSTGCKVRQYNTLVHPSVGQSSVLKRFTSVFVVSLERSVRLKTQVRVWLGLRIMKP